ncbi:MAG: hypothetical protein WAP36_01075 [Halanaerobiales bacterium]
MNSLQGKRFLSPFCIAVAIFAVVLIGLGAYLITIGFPTFINVGLIVAGVLLLVLCCSRFVPRIVCCILLVLVTLFLVVVGIIGILISLVIGIIILVLAVIALILAAICFAISAARRFDIDIHDVNYQA